MALHACSEGRLRQVPQGVKRGSMQLWIEAWPARQCLCMPQTQCTLELCSCENQVVGSPAEHAVREFLVYCALQPWGGCYLSMGVECAVF